MQFELDFGSPKLSKKTPLVYPGGKAKSIKLFKLYLPRDVKTMVSPFIGGGAIELYCAARGIDVTASDNFEPLTNFWQHFIEDPEKLMSAVLDIFPMSHEQRSYYYHIGLKPDKENFFGDIYSDFDRAVIFFLLNRQSFRGWTLAYGQGKNYNKDVAKPEFFEKMKSWYNPNIKVFHGDYKETIDKYNGTFMYFDPPYVDKEECYGWYKEDTPVFDHVEFADRISRLDNKWILSYMKHDLVMDLYKDYEIVEYKYKYTIHYAKDGDHDIKDSTELFILNL